MKISAVMVITILVLLSVSSYAATVMKLSLIQQNLVTLEHTDHTTHLWGRKKADLLSNQYDLLFRPLQKRTVLQHLGEGDLAALYQAAHAVTFYAHDKNYLNDMVLDMQILQQHGAVTGMELDQMYQSFISLRQFDAAKQFLATHPSLDVEPLPHVERIPAMPSDAKLVLQTVPGQNTLIEKPIVLNRQIQIIVVGHPLCHFTQHAVQDLQHYPDVWHALNQHAIWIAPQDGILDITDFQKWNRHYPEAKMAAVYNQNDWPMIDYWGTPTFYFMRNGKLVDEVSGWPNLTALEQGMRKLGLLNAIASKPQAPR
jgi:hypothetical protein